jgi:hypothetical protein
VHRSAFESAQANSLILTHDRQGLIAFFVPGGVRSGVMCSVGMLHLPELQTRTAYLLVELAGVTYWQVLRSLRFLTQNCAGSLMMLQLVSIA